MIWIAFRMLIGNRGKYLGIVLGIAFASLLIAQQASIFCGLMLRTSSQVKDIQSAGIWVRDPNMQFVDDIKPMTSTALLRVRGVPGVKWAVPLYKGLSRVRLSDGNYQQIILIGVDDATLVGAPTEMLYGSIFDLQRPDAVIIDDAGWAQLWPDEPYHAGKTFELNDRRAFVVGVCKASRTFQTFPVVYSRFKQATTFVPMERRMLSFVLAEAQDGRDVDEVCAEIEKRTDLMAIGRVDFAWKTMRYYMERTGIPVNFGITVILGFIVGTAIAGQTFYLFTIENLRQFAMLKAMGASDRAILGMVLFKAVVVGASGYGLGVGMAALFGQLTLDASKLAFYMPWEVMVITAAAVVLMLLLSSVLSVRRVLTVEPAIVFQG